MKYIISLIALLFSLSIYSKENSLEGKTLLNASVGIGYGDKEGFIFHAKPRLLKYILPRLAIGVLGEYYREKNYSRFGLGPSADLNFLTLGDFDFILGQHVLYAKESTQTPGILGISDIGTRYSLSQNFLLGITFGKMYYLTKKHTTPKDSNFANIAFIFIF